MTTFKLPLDARLLHDYLERRLDSREEQAFEEAMIADPDIAEQVRLELAMRDGMRELSRREREKPRSAPHSAHSEARHSGSNRHAVRGPRRWRALAAAAVVALAVGVPTSLLLLRGGAGVPGPGLAAEETLAPRVGDGGQLAAYDLPAQLVALTPDGGDDAAPPLRLSLPEGVSEIVLQLPAGAPATPHRLVLSRADRPQVSVALAAARLPDSQQEGFTLATEQLPPGQYQAQIERLENGAWLQDRQFVLRVEGRR
jgi:hypothetical protein